MVRWVDGADHFVPTDGYVDQGARAMPQITCFGKSPLLYSVRLVTSLRHNEITVLAMCSVMVCMEWQISDVLESDLRCGILHVRGKKHTPTAQVNKKLG